MQGGLVAQSVPGLPFLLEEGMKVYFVPPLLKEPKYAVISSIESLQEQSALVYFAGIEDIHTTEKLIGKYCVVAREDLPESLTGFELDCAGFEVIDEEKGSLGLVEDIIINPGQSLLVVRRPKGTELLIPLVEEFIACFNEEDEVITVHVPQSLIDLTGE